MIRRNLAMTFNDSARIAARSSVALVIYLRARRAVANPLASDFVRRLALAEKRAARQEHLMDKRK